MAKRSVNTLSRVKGSLLRGEEEVDTTKIFQPLLIRQGDCASIEIPKETDGFNLEEKTFGTLFFVPRDSERADDVDTVLPIVVVAKVAFRETTVGSRIAEEGVVVFILRANDVVGVPDVDDGVCDVAGVAAGGGGTEREIMIDVEEVGNVALYDKEGFVIGVDGCISVESFDVQRTGLGSNRRTSNLRLNNKINIRIETRYD